MSDGFESRWHDPAAAASALCTYTHSPCRDIVQAHELGMAVVNAFNALTAREQDGEPRPDGLAIGVDGRHRRRRL